MLSRAFRDDDGSGEEVAVAEINLDLSDDADGACDGLHLMALQEAKRADDACCTVVVHTRAYQERSAESAAAEGAPPLCGLEGELAPRAIRALAARLGDVSEGELRTLLLHERAIDWTVAQVAAPMEALVPDPPKDPPWRHLQSAGAGALIVAGDFMTQSSFLGCVASADAAAEAVWAALFGESGAR